MWLSIPVFRRVWLCRYLLCPERITGTPPPQFNVDIIARLGAPHPCRLRCPLWVVISTGRRNTLTKTQKMACMLMNQRRRRGLHGSRESGAVGPLEASRGAEVDWASVWRTLIVRLSPVDAARGGSKPQQRGLTQVLHRPVEIAVDSGR